MPSTTGLGDMRAASMPVQVVLGLRASPWQLAIWLVKCLKMNDYHPVSGREAGHCTVVCAGSRPGVLRELHGSKRRASRKNSGLQLSNRGSAIRAAHRRWSCCEWFDHTNAHNRSPIHRKDAPDRCSATAKESDASSGLAHPGTCRHRPVRWLYRGCNTQWECGEHECPQRASCRDVASPTTMYALWLEDYPSVDVRVGATSTLERPHESPLSVQRAAGLICQGHSTDIHSLRP